MGGCSLDALDESSQGVGWLEDQAEWVDDDTVDGRLSSVSILYGIYEDYMDYMISINNPYKYWWYYYPVIIPISKKCFIVTNSYLVGGDWNMNGLWLSTYWEFHHPNWLSYFSEGLKPPTRYELVDFLYTLWHNIAMEKSSCLIYGGRFL